MVMYVTTVSLPATGAATSIETWNACDEYGDVISGTADTGPIRYGWLGAKQRATTETGLALMGVRVYNPSTGLFSSVDPVRGGNANAYTYPGDPVNSFDLDGQRRSCKWKPWEQFRCYKKAAKHVYRQARYTYRTTSFSFGGCAIICYGAGFQGGYLSVTNISRSRQYGWATPGFTIGRTTLRATSRGKHCTGGGFATPFGGLYGCGSGKRSGRKRDFEGGFTSFGRLGVWGGRQRSVQWKLGRFGDW